MPINLKHENEQRKHKRYFVKDHIFAMVRSKNHQLSQIENMSKGEIGFAVLKSNPLKMGQIIEASLGGLSFSYIENKTELSKSSEMDILFADKDFHLSRIPFKPVEDTTLDRKAPFGTLPMKRMTVQFRDLTPHQQIKLGHLLDKYTIGEVPDPLSIQAQGSRI